MLCPARRSRGLTLLEVLIALALVGVMLCVALVIARRDDVPGCKRNLQVLGVALRLYLDSHGRRTQYPDADGSDFLIRLYATGHVVDPGRYLCPATGDVNDRGRALRPGRGRAPVNAASYAGRRNALNGQHAWPGMFTHRASFDRAVASDDDEGPGLRYNHGRPVVLYEDAHAEVIPVDRTGLGSIGAARRFNPEGYTESRLGPLGN